VRQAIGRVGDVCIGVEKAQVLAIHQTVLLSSKDERKQGAMAFQPPADDALEAADILPGRLAAVRA
jgi:hypothetical protein